MKKILLTLTLFAAAFAGFGQTVMVKKVGNSYVISFPTDLQAFRDDNDIATKSTINRLLAELESTVNANKTAATTAITNLTNYVNAELETLSKNMPYYRVLIDTSPTIAYSNGTKIDFFTVDGELKVMYGTTLVYWFSTLGNTRSLEYLNHPARDPGAKAWFQCADIASKDGRDWILFDSTKYNSIFAQARALSGTTSPEINGIMIQPNIGGLLNDGKTKVADIWNNTNAQLKPTILRFNGSSWETSKYGGVKWRMANFTNSHTQIPE